MSAVIAHHNEKIFPNSRSFILERWSDQPDGGRFLEKYLVSFSKGSRQCIGIKYDHQESDMVVKANHYIAGEG